MAFRGGGRGPVNAVGVSRRPVHKAASAAEFRGNVSRTKAQNVQHKPMRGGWRI